MVVVVLSLLGASRGAIAAGEEFRDAGEESGDAAPDARVAEAAYTIAATGVLAVLGSSSPSILLLGAIELLAIEGGLAQRNNGRYNANATGHGPMTVVAMVVLHVACRQACRRGCLTYNVSVGG